MPLWEYPLSVALPPRGSALAARCTTTAGALAVIAMRAPDSARAAYSFMQDLVYASAAPLSVLALVSGIVLGLGTKWGLLRFRWVATKLVLLLLVVLAGITIQGPLLEQLIAAPSPTTQTANLAVTAVQFVLLAVATWLSVFKPGGRIRQVRHAVRCVREVD